MKIHQVHPQDYSFDGQVRFDAVLDSVKSKHPHHEITWLARVFESLPRSYNFEIAP